MANGRMEAEVIPYVAGLITWIMDQPLREPIHATLEDRMRLCDAIIELGCGVDRVEELPRVLLQLYPYHAPSDAGCAADVPQPEQDLPR